MLKPKILIVICVALSIIIIFLINQSIVNSGNISQKNSEYITKGDINKNPSSTLPQNYTSQDLLDYCTKNESQSYNDICIRGLWQVEDICKNKNFSSNNSICNDPRFDELEIRVNNVMQNLDKSLIRVADSCNAVNSNTDIQSCLVNMERIKNDCDEPHFYSLMNICTDPRLDRFIQKYKNSS